MLRKLLVVGLVSTTMLACSKKSNEEHKSVSNPLPDRPIISVAGNWDSFDGTDPNHAIFNLTQSNIAVSGSFNLNSGAMIASVTGSCDTDIFRFSLSEPAPCPGTFTGSAVFNGAQLQGSLTGSDCGGPATVTFQLHKI